MIRRLNPFATLSVLVVAGAIAVAWASLGHQSPKAPYSHPSAMQSSPFSSFPFTADVTITKPSGGVYHGKMFADKNATRTDVEMQPGKVASVIVRYDKRVSWVLMPAQHYLESPLADDGGMMGLLRDPTAQMQRKDLGAAQVGSYPCEKYRLQATLQGKPQSGIIWVARAPALHGFIVKAQQGDQNDAITFSNIRLGPPQRSVFEIPAGYSKLPEPSPAAPNSR
jgi:hypothetical protein